MRATSRTTASRKQDRFLVRPLFAALVAAGIAVPAHGATIVVTTGGDSGTGSTCTLRQAIASLNGAAVVDGCVNSGPGFGLSDVVDLTAQSGTITLAGGVALPVSVTMALDGPGASVLTISGANAGRVFEVAPSVITFELGNVSVASGRSTGPGGCIYAPSPASVGLIGSVITGCRANDDPNLPATPFNGVGGGVFAGNLAVVGSTISGNTAQTAGGGVSSGSVYMNQSLVTGNTVLGETINFDNYDPGGGGKYYALILGVPAAGGGGMLVGEAQIAYSVVSNNAVHATTFFGTVTDGEQNYNQQLRVGTGGGITVAPFKYTDPDLTASTAGSGKSTTIAGARTLLPRPTAAKPASFRAMAQRVLPPEMASRMGRPKADGLVTTGLGVRNSTISGNQIIGAGAAPGGTRVYGKYSGGGAAFLTPSGYNAEFANSTISGNRIPTNGVCSPPTGPQTQFRISCGAGLIGDSVEMSNSTVTANVGPTAVEFKYNIESVATGTLSAKAAKATANHPGLAQWVSKVGPIRSRGATATKAFAKAGSPPIFDSTIVASNSGTYDVGCFSTPCTIGGSANLVGTASSLVTLPGGTLSVNPQLAPLANNGGALAAGAPGVAGTGPTPTHALYVGSPAVGAGNNLENFDYDQRGQGFPRTVGIGTDIGAYEGTVKKPEAAPVPALGPWMLGALSAFVGLLGFLRGRRRG